MTSARIGYPEAVASLESALRFGTNPSLAGIRALTRAMGCPQDAFRAVQVTGTNGKTSVTRMCAALLAAHGHKVGTYTSPHLLEYRERIEIGGAAVGREPFTDAIAAALAAAGQAGLPTPPTEFELLTAAALWLFRQRAVDWAALEVGMGGRWDATSVASPAVAVITGVALDHTHHLGSTIEAIAEEKASIVRQGCTAVLGPGTEAADAIFAARAADAGARVIRVRDAGSGDAPPARAADVRFMLAARPDGPDGRSVISVKTAETSYTVSLRAPAYQAVNAAVALAAVEAATGSALDADAVSEALRDIRFPGRFQALARDPWLIADGAHNPQAASVLAGAVADAFGARQPTAVLAVLDDKDAAGIVAALAGGVRAFVVTESASPRALPREALARIVENVTGRAARLAPSVAGGVALARADGDTVVTGSLTTAAEAIAAMPADTPASDTAAPEVAMPPANGEGD